MTTVIFQNHEENIDQLRTGKAILHIESWMPNEYIGKLIRRKLEQASGTPIKVVYDIITEEMQQVAHDFSIKE